jgi:hypothetical protein
MVRFARECHLKMGSLSRELEIALGPDTADLAFRIGIHSGPVTGGVLRGQNSRFQLFGKLRDELMSTSNLLVQNEMSEQYACLLYTYR